MTGGEVGVDVGIDDQVADVALDTLGVREGKDEVVEGAGLKGVKVKPNFFFPAAFVDGGGVGEGTTWSGFTLWSLTVSLGSSGDSLAMFSSTKRHTPEKPFVASGCKFLLDWASRPRNWFSGFYTENGVHKRGKCTLLL